MVALSSSTSVAHSSARRDVASQAAQAAAPGQLAVQRAIFSTLRAQARALAHALGNPLTGLGLTLELLASSQLSETQQRYVDRCIRVAERMNGHKENLGHLGNPQGVRMQPVDLAACIDGVIAHLRLGPSFAVSVDLAPGSQVAVAHAGLLAEALTALLRNAYEALGEGGALGVRGISKGDHVYLTIWDRGPGLSVEAESQLWLAPIAGKAHSAGMGLFWAAAIVDEVLGGRLSYSREPQGGAAFELMLAAPSVTS